MKTILSSLGLALAVTACGSNESGSSNKGLPGDLPGLQDPVTAEVTSLDATIGKVEHWTLPFTTPQGALGGKPQTRIEVSYAIPCWQGFPYAALSYEKADGKVKVYSHALVSTPVDLGDMLCQAFSLETKEINLEGHFEEKDIELVNLSSEKFFITEDITVMSPAKSVKIAKIDPTPMGMGGGTNVTLEAEVNSCVNNIGEVGFALSQSSDGKPVLNVSVPELQSKQALAAFCQEGPYTVQKRIFLESTWIVDGELLLNQIK